MEKVLVSSFGPRGVKVQASVAEFAGAFCELAANSLAATRTALRGALCGPLALHLGTDGSAGLKGFDRVLMLKGFDQVTIQALVVLLGVGKQDHENQGRQDTSAYEVLDHGCHSTS